MIDVSSLEKALASLDTALAAHAEKPTDVFIRDAAIQRFEYTYELSYKLLRRYLEQTEPSIEVVQELSFLDLIRLASERGLLKSELVVWRKFRENRNATSHAYDEVKAEAVFSGIASFRDDAKALLDEINTRQAKNL